MKKIVLKEQIIKYILKKYKIKQDFPWIKNPDSGVFRHQDTRKWFGLVMPVPKKYIALGEGFEDMLTIKCDPVMIDNLTQKDGYYRAYHMNKTQWITIRLNGLVDEKTIYNLIDESFELTKK